MAAVIRLVPDKVFPKSPLPDTALAACLAHIAQALSLRQRLRESRLDQLPSQGKISVSRRQRPYRVDMIRQHDNGIDNESVAATRPLHRIAQTIDAIDKQGVSTLKEIDRKDPAPPGTNARR